MRFKQKDSNSRLPQRAAHVFNKSVGQTMRVGSQLTPKRVGSFANDSFETERCMVDISAVIQYEASAFVFPFGFGFKNMHL